VIDELARRGFRTVPEVARAFIDDEMRKGRRLVDIKSDAAWFEGRIFRTKLAVETRLPAYERLFLDRALPDSIAYYRLYGLHPAEPMDHSRQIRYWAVFLFERLGLITDPVRSENPDTADRIERLIEEAYRELGYPLVRVPVLPIGERAEFVLSRSKPAI
jgi:predicted ATPase